MFYSLFSETLCKMFVINAILDRRRPVTSLRHQEGRRVFRERPKFFELRPIFLKYWQHIFPGGAHNFLAGEAPPGYGPGPTPAFSCWQDLRDERYENKFFALSLEMRELCCKQWWDSNFKELVLSLQVSLTTGSLIITIARANHAGCPIYARLVFVLPTGTV